MSKVKTNFGSIMGQRTVTFKRNFSQERVAPAKFKRIDVSTLEDDDMITPHEAFRRWKIARKAWRSRKERNQIMLPL